MEWTKKLPSEEREPYEAFKILNQRIYLSEKLLKIAYPQNDVQSLRINQQTLIFNL